MPAEADLVVVGNPTNPTGVLHPAADVRALAAPGRVLLVDEAFADAVPGEPESLAGGGRRAGLLVFRSLTKTWALAGLRAGYALGEPDLLARLAAPRPPWPVSTLALEAVVACSMPQAVAEAGGRRSDWPRNGRSRPQRWRRVPGVTVLPGAAPYLLLRLPDGHGERVRAALREAGIAVRRGDTFPGLGPDHVRVAVRPAAQVTQLVTALAETLAAVAA